MKKMLGSTLLDRYRISGKLGDGGFGVVYRAEDLVLGRQVAVKLLRPDALDMRSADRLAQEARMIAQLDHPSIVSIYDFNCREDPLFLVMPILRGQTLLGLLDHGPLGQEDTLEVGIQLAEALAYSHAHGVLHGDVQPANIMVDRGSRGKPLIKLIDFGLAGEPTSIKDSQELRGTPRFLSPEQISAHQVDERTDLYSLGVLLYESVVGEPAFSGPTLVKLAWYILTTPPKSPKELGVEIDPGFEELILSCLEKQPENRPQSAHEVASTLQSLQRQIACGALISLPREIPKAPVSRANFRPVAGDTVEGCREQLTDRLGDMLLVSGDYPGAREAYDHARELRRDCGQSEACAEALYLLKMSHLESKSGQYEEGLKHCQAGLDLLQPSDASLRAKLRAMGALIHCCLEAWDEAGRWVEAGFSSLSSSETALDVAGRVLLLRAQGNLMIGRGQYHDALAAYRKALGLSSDLADRWEHSICLFNVGEAWLHLGAHDRAREYLAEAFLEKSAIGDRWGLAYVHYSLARIALESSNLDEALLQIRAGLRLAEEISDPKITAMLRESLDRYAEQCEQLGSASPVVDVVGVSDRS